MSLFCFQQNKMRSERNLFKTGSVQNGICSKRDLFKTGSVQNGICSAESFLVKGNGKFQVHPAAAYQFYH